MYSTDLKLHKNVFLKMWYVVYYKLRKKTKQCNQNITMKQITLKWKKSVSKLNLIKRKIYLESNLYKIKALFWKKNMGKSKNWAKRYTSFTQEALWNKTPSYCRKPFLGHRGLKIVYITTSVENATNDGFLTVIYHKK